MVKYKEIIFLILILFFLSFSFYPTIFELRKSKNLKDQRREFILEHNYYWPDFNLYLSKIRQGYEGHLTALEKYTSEPHQGSLIQIFYVALGFLGKSLQIDPNFSYQLGRIMLSPVLLSLVAVYSLYFFRASFFQLLGFVVVIISGSFPRFYTESQGLHIGRFMEWWSNIDALQRITFIPHILFGQITSFYLLYELVLNKSKKSLKKIVFFILLANLTGLVFPPSLITLLSVLFLLELVKISAFHHSVSNIKNFLSESVNLKFVLFTLPSLFYLFFITRFIPWSALVEYHRAHPMITPVWDYILGTGPVFFLGIFGALISFIKKDKIFYPLAIWLLVTFSYALLFSFIREQSPLRFTQTGLFLPLGILSAYFIYSTWEYLRTIKGGLKSFLRGFYFLAISFYLLENLYIMKVSLDWQLDFITQRANANIPDVPYPPRTMYPLRQWMDGIRWLKDHTNHDKVVLAEITAGNFIPAYSGNTVYFGQSNTVDFNRKQLEIDSFFKGEMTPLQAKRLLIEGRISYVFVSIQEKELLIGKNIEEIYPFLRRVYSNPLATIYNYN